MKIYLNKITGIDDAMVSLLMSKRSWSKEEDQNIRGMVEDSIDKNGFCKKVRPFLFAQNMDKLIKYGVEQQHTTLLRFIDLSFTVEGLHRAGQDDWDAHVKRMDNRIIRASTRLSSFKEGEISDYYKEKIMFPFEVFNKLGIEIPNGFKDELGNEYIKTEFGYIRKDLMDNKDVKRGLYPLSIPSNFIFKVQYPELCHIIQFRDDNGHANPEVKELAESIKEQVTIANRWLGENLTKLKMEPKSITHD